MRILIIAPFFPPWARVGAQRPGRFAAGLAARGHQVAVVQLARAGAVSPELAALPRLALGVPKDAATTSGRRKGRLIEAIDRALPVDGWLPVLMAKSPHVHRFARDFDPDVVWSTADPWSSLVLGQRVAARLDRPWIADLRDPWTPCGVRHARRPALTRALDHRLEAALLPRAEAVVLTAEETAARYAETFPALRQRMRVIRNGYTGQALPFDDRPGPSGPLTLRFFGRFRPLSSARWAVAAVAASGRAGFIVRSVGGLDPDDQRRAEEAGVAALFEGDEAVPPERGRARLRESDVLLLSTEPGRDEIVPAKLFDYLGAGRPVLALTQSPEVRRLLETCGVGRAFARADEAAAWIDAAVTAKQRGAPVPGPFRPDPAAIAAHHSDVGVAALEGLLLDCAKRRSARPTRADSRAD
jgi:glycosyltransferase involved in cell wall biosynthesis